MKILIVDDEHDVQLLFEQRFRKEIQSGLVESVFAHSGNDALTILEQTNPVDYLLILSDINMPGMNGIELLKSIKSSYHSLQVYMVTAYDTTQYYEQAIFSGADGYITKPVDFADLKNNILHLMK